MTIRAIGTEILVSTANAGDQGGQQITPLANGGFVVTWHSIDNGSNYDIRGRVFAADGTPVNGSDFLVSTTNAGSQTNARITPLANGAFVVTWAYNDYNHSGRLFTADGTPVDGSEFLLADMSGGEITALANGGFVAAWVVSLWEDTTNFVAGSVFAADGTRVKSFTASHFGDGETSPQITGL